jgi:hypothetical protein
MEKQTVKYQDQNGTIEGSLSYDGNLLHLQLSGVKFSSGFMDGFSPESTEIDPRFQLDAHNDLTNFTLQFYLPMRFLITDKVEFLNLACELSVQKDKDNYSHPYLRCKLLVNDTVINMPTAGTIEGAIEQLNAKLPQNIKFIGCYNCKFSDYSIYGQQFWGSMLCFKNIKEIYSKIDGKDEYMEIMDDFDRLVPESHYCDEFEERPKTHSGYRG